MKACYKSIRSLDKCSINLHYKIKILNQTGCPKTKIPMEKEFN
jgi:hypothetical protein